MNARERDHFRGLLEGERDRLRRLLEDGKAIPDADATAAPGEEGEPGVRARRRSTMSFPCTS